MVLCKQHNILHINGLSTFFSLFFGGNSRIQVHDFFLEQHYKKLILKSSILAFFLGNRIIPQIQFRQQFHFTPGFSLQQASQHFHR